MSGVWIVSSITDLLRSWWGVAAFYKMWCDTSAVLENIRAQNHNEDGKRRFSKETGSMGETIVVLQGTKKMLWMYNILQWNRDKQLLWWKCFHWVRTRELDVNQSVVGTSCHVWQGSSRPVSPCQGRTLGEALYCTVCVCVLLRETPLWSLRVKML